MYRLLSLLVVLVTLVPSLAVAQKENGALRYDQTSLFLRNASGQWEALDVFQTVNRTTYITAAAQDPSDPNRLAVGTSFAGIHESRDGGRTWTRLDELRATVLYQGSGFYDEVTSLAYAPDAKGNLLFSIGFGGGTWLYDRAAKKATATSVTLPRDTPVEPTFFSQDSLPVPTARMDAASVKARRERAANRTGVYVNPGFVHGAKLDSLLDRVKNLGMNSIVVDFKDDLGMLVYDSALELPKKAGAVSPRFKVAELLAKAHARGIYVIARVVVFKDRQLHRYERNAYALWDRVTNKAWGVFRTETPEATEDNPKPTPVTTQIEYWVDPYSSFVHDYNISIALELEKLGIDEIQFDYIRFPSDGNTRNILARFHKNPDGTTKTTEGIRDRVIALSTFLSKARSAISIPISTDVFGFNGWARMSYLGQDIQAFSHYVDVISPMAYPSHYALDFLPKLTYFDRASHIYEHGTVRSRAITEERVLIRPYVQAFLIGNERRYEESRYFDYLNRQVRSTLKGGGSGFTLWNNTGNYYMVNDPVFKSILEGK